MTLFGDYLILFYRCSVDPYLFENFVTTDGDYLKAKFRAFKFPESSFVLFKGTVNVCLDTCSPVSQHCPQRGIIIPAIVSAGAVQQRAAWIRKAEKSSD